MQTQIDLHIRRHDRVELVDLALEAVKVQNGTRRFEPARDLRIVAAGHFAQTQQGHRPGHVQHTIGNDRRDNFPLQAMVRHRL